VSVAAKGGCRSRALLSLVVCGILAAVGGRIGYLAQRAGEFTELDYVVRSLVISGVVGVAGVTGLVWRRTRPIGVALLCGALSQLAGCFAGHTTAYWLRPM
jgi:hypothetical protein